MFLVTVTVFLLFVDATDAVQDKPSTPPVDEHSDRKPPGQDQDIEDIDLLDIEIAVVVTASRREQSVNTLPYAVSVITAEDIRRFGARSVPDALRLATGVDVAELSFGSAGVSPRGLHGFISRQVLVLVDGRQIYDSWFGGTLWSSWPVQLEDIARIEVIRGPAGVTWGANAVHGAINIITKDPRDQRGLTFSATAGSRGSQKEHIGYGFGDDKLRFRISGEYDGSDGFARGGSLFRGLDDDYRSGRIGLHLIYEPNDRDRFLFSAGHATLDEGFSPPPTAGIHATRRSGSQASFIMGQWQRRLGPNNTIQFNGYLNDFSASSGLKAIDYRYQQLAFQLSHTFSPVENHTLTWGVDTRVDLMDAGNAHPQQLSKDFVSTAIIGIYAQDEWRFAPRWTLNLGARIDYEFYGGFQPSGRAALSYELTDDSLLYGAVSRAFQMMPAALRFTEFPLLNGLSYVTVNRDSKAQTLMAYELGYRARWFERLTLNWNLFWMVDSNVSTLQPRLGPPGLLRFHADSVADASIYGSEFDWRWRANSRLTLLGNYTYQQSKWNADTAFQGTDAITAPKHKFMLGARYSPTDDLHLSAHAFWVDAVTAPDPLNPFGSKRIDPYWRLDLRGEYEFWKDQASLAIGVRNLLDSHHPEGASQFINDAEVSRMIYAEMRFSVK